MQTLLTLLLSGVVAGLMISCSPTGPSTAHSEAPAPENGAQFRKGEGLAITDEMKQVIGLKTVEVAEEKVARSFSVSLRVTPPGDVQPVSLTSNKPTSREATGWLTGDQAALLKIGLPVELRSEATDAAVEMGTVTRIEKPGYASMGDYEIAVATAKPWPQGSTLLATFRLPPGDPVSSIPRSALLKTAEGTFAYTVNGKFFVRTPVKIGAMNEQTVEVTDGLYSGDEVVSAPVMSLWMAELQVLRGGKACTCGH